MLRPLVVVEAVGGAVVSGSQRHSVAEVARLLGVSERAVRDRVERRTLDAVKEPGQRGCRILLPPDAAADAAADAVGEAVGCAVVMR